MLRTIIKELLQIHYPDIKEKDPIKTTTRTEALRAAIEQVATTGKITELQKTLILQLLSSSEHEKEAVPMLAEMQEYKPFKPKLYQEIYPYLALAHAFEGLGDAAEHASKLACMFTTTEQVLKYLHEYATKHPKSSKFVHDACLFSLPSASSNTDYWFALAKTKNNLFNPTFLALLPLSLDIEQQISNDEKNKDAQLSKLKERYSPTDAKKIAAEINANIKTLQKWCDKFAAGYGEERTPENKEKNRDYLAQLVQLHDDRAIIHLHLKKGFAQYGINDLSDVRERVLAQLNPNDKFLVAHGIDKKNRQIFWQLDRKQAGNNIPDVCIDCGDGFYIKKLNIQDDDAQAALGASLGALSDSCQTVGKAGHRYVIHGLTNANSGFYVLFKKNPEKLGMPDEVWGQTWVNRTQSGGLVFDSIESAQGKQSEKTAKIVTTAFRNLANELITRPDVPWVHCGTKSGISAEAGMASNYQCIAEAPLNFSGPHDDSATQLLLADKKLLFTLKAEDKTLLLNETELTKELKEFKEDGLLPEKLRFTFGFLIKSKNTADLIQLMKKIPGDRQPLLKQYIILNSKISKWAQTYNRHSKLLTELESETKNPNIDCDFLNSLLFKAVEHGHIEVVKSLLTFSNNPDINAKNELGNTVLMIAVHRQHTDIIKILLDAKADIHIRNNHDETPMQLAEKNGDTGILQLLKDYANPVKPPTKPIISTIPVTSGLSIFTDDSKSPGGEKDKSQSFALAPAPLSRAASH